jgi:hypothetical protein
MEPREWDSPPSTGFSVFDVLDVLDVLDFT